MNPSVIWELVRPSYFLPALKKGVRIRKSGLRRSAEPPEMGFLEEESSRVFLLGEGEGGGLPGGAERPPPRPPRGFLAVYVGPEMRRFVIPASYLCQPAFRELMEQAAEEFGFQQEGGLQIPCDEATFQELLRRAAALEGTAAAAATAGGKAGRKTKKLAARQ